MSTEIISESDLIKMCAKADRRYQSSLYNKFAPKMMTVCYRYSRTKEDAEDILMEGFVKVFANISQFKNEGSFEGWIRRIMINTAIAKFKKSNPFEVIINLDKIHYSLPSDENIYDELGAKVLINMIQQLPPAYQMIFNLYSFEGMKHREIAEKLGISEGTSKSNLSDARTLLKKMIDKTNTYELKALSK